MTEDRSRELNQFWNAVVAGESVADGFALDADDMDTVRRLNHVALATTAGSRAEAAWPGVLARILAAEAATDEPSAWVHRRKIPAPSLVPNGRHYVAAAPARKPDPWRSLWHLKPGALATAALVLLSLIAGLLTIGPLGAPPRDTVVPLPAVENTGIAVGHFEPLWQARGNSDHLDAPSDLAIDAEGRIWVVDASRGTIEIFAPDGTFLESWGGPGTGDGQFSFSGIHPYSFGDIAFGPDGSIYVVDTGNVRVQKFAPDRRFLLSWGEEGEADGQFLQPAAIAVDPAGMVYVSDEQLAIIQVFDAEGRFLNAFGGLGVEEGQLILPQGIALDPRGLLWVVDRGNNRLQQFDAEGNVHAIVGTVGFDEGELNQPHDVAVDRLGRLYVAEEGMSRVQVLDQDGRALASVSGYADNSLFSPLGVAVAADGAVYISDTAGLKAFRVLLPTSALLMP
jgi:DNA-binding beta-propeller fold protein YncE